MQKGGEDALLTSSQYASIYLVFLLWQTVLEDGMNKGLMLDYFRRLFVPSKFHPLFSAYGAWRGNAQYYSTHPRELMAAAVQNNSYEGSSTMTIVTMDVIGRIHTANLGDSGYKIFRRYPNGQF